MIRKRILFSFILFFCFMMFLSSCGKINREDPIRPDEEDMESDQQHLYNADQDENHFNSLFTATDDAVFFMSGMDYGEPNLLVYADKKSDSSGLLCGKPECLHSGKNCNAYFGNGTILALSKYGESRLILVFENGNSGNPCDLEVVTVKTDGTDRKHLRNIPDPWEGAGHLNTWVLVHRDYVFISGVKQTVEQGEISNTAFVNAYPLNSDEVIPVYEGQENPYADGRICLQAADNCMYYLDSEMKATEDPETRELWVTAGEWNIQTKTGRELYSGKFPLYIWDARVRDNSILLSGLGSNEIYRIGIADSTVEKVLDFPDKNKAAVTIAFTSDGIVCYSYPYMPDYSMRQVTISDYSGEIVNQYERTEDLITYKESVYTRTFCGSDGENLYYYFDGKKDEKTKQRCMRSISIKTGEMKTLWQEIIPSF